MDGFNRRVATGKVHWYPGKSAKKKHPQKILKRKKHGRYKQRDYETQEIE